MRFVARRTGLARFGRARWLAELAACLFTVPSKISAISALLRIVRVHFRNSLIDTPVSKPISL